MDKLDLENKYRDFIKQTVSSVLDNAEIFIFGSRTQNKAQEYSDVDIALRCSDEIPAERIIKLKTIFHDSTFPYKVDIVDLNTLDENFLKIIEKDLYRIK